MASTSHSSGGRTPDVALRIQCKLTFYLNVSINGTLVLMELDTGAAVSIMSVNTQNKYLPNINLMLYYVPIRVRKY